MSAAERNNVTVLGDGPMTMVLAHGYGCDQTMWRLVAPHFAETYRVVTFDYVGCGKADVRSYDPRRYATLGGYAQDVLDICSELDVQNAVFVGHSVSSMVGLLAAKQQPNHFEKLVMLCPSPRYVNEPDFEWGFDRAAIEGLLDMIEGGRHDWSTFLAGLVVHDDERQDLAAELEQSFCTMEPDIARRFAAATFYADNRADLVGFDARTLIVQCTRDIVSAPPVGQYVHEHLANSTMSYLDVAGHCPHLSHPAQTIETIDAFLAAA